ncbi:MAG: hypothetical protein ABL993_14665 [Vicinamibacterales bacterium]
MTNARWVVRASFCALLILGAMTYRSIGVPWDELHQRDFGRAVVDYVLGIDQRLLTHNDRYYGPIFEIILNGAERVVGISDSRDIHLFRHALTFLLFAGACASFYCLLRRALPWTWALLGAFVFVMSPRILAEAFYNTKDIALLAAVVLSMHSLMRFLERPSYASALVHALACAFAGAIRLSGMLAVGITMLLLLDEAIQGRWERKAIYNVLRLTAVYLVASLSLTVLFWPFLWTSPWVSFVEAVNQMGSFPWNQDVFYMGSYLKANMLPWHYLPVWIAITIPLLHVIAVCVGVPVASIAVVRRWRSQGTKDPGGRRLDLVALLWLLLPLVLVWVVQPVLYDGWRHFYFVYAALVLLAVRGLRAAWSFCDRRALTRAVLMAITVALFLEPVLFLRRNYPFGWVYFSPIVGGIAGANGRFELDYWGVSYRQGLEELLRREEGIVRVSFANESGDANVEILPAADRRRIVVVSQQAAAYHLTEHRWHYGEPDPYAEAFSIRVDGVRILTAYHVRK